MISPYELSKLQERASIGDVNAINELIDFYLADSDLKHAKLEAERLKYISSSAAYRKLGLIYVNGLLGETNISLAKSYFQKAFELGDDVSGYNLALILIKEGHPEEAVTYLTSGVGNDHIPSIKLLANLYIKGDVLAKDLNIALALLKKVYDLGETSVVSSLGKVCYQLNNYEEAFKYFSLGVQSRDPDSLYYLGLCYASGLGVKQDFAKARFYYEQGANLNEPRCLYNLSLYYRNGIGVEQNILLADSLLQQARLNGFKN